MIPSRVFDLHCDTLSKLWAYPDEGTFAKSPWSVTLPRLQASQYVVQDMAIYLDLKERNHPFQDFIEMAQIFHRICETYEEEVRPIYDYSNIEASLKDQKIGLLLSIEEGGILEGDLAHAQQAYDLGVRLITISWNYRNGYSHPHCDPEPTLGLTEAGFHLVEWMEEKGIIIDVSHMNDASFKDVLEHTKKPFLASHSNSRFVHNHSRNLPDSLIRALGERQGLMGLNFCHKFLSPRFESTVDAMVEHVSHIASVGGMGLIALGTDFDGIDSLCEISHPGEMETLYEGLRKKGFTAQECDGFFYINALTFCKEIL